MNWAEIGTELITSVIGIVLSAITCILTYLINKYIKNDKLKTLCNSFNELVRDSVTEVHQTYVEALKKDGMFDKDKQEEALNKCMELIKKNMNNDVKKWLYKNFDDIEDYIKDTIEANVGYLKKKM